MVLINAICHTLPSTERCAIPAALKMLHLSSYKYLLPHLNFTLYSSPSHHS